MVPYASCQRGLNENTNKLIRQYLPKKSDFHEYSNCFFKKIQNNLNARPRKCLNFKTPNDLFFHNFDRPPIVALAG